MANEVCLLFLSLLAFSFQSGALDKVPVQHGGEGSDLFNRWVNFTSGKHPGQHTEEASDMFNQRLNFTNGRAFFFSGGGGAVNNDSLWIEPALTSSSVHEYPQTGLKEEDEITSLPGDPEDIDFNQYSGYVTVDPENQRHLFYYFVESPSNPSTKPLLLLLNGGRWCSSFGMGGFQGVGPFVVNPDGFTLRTNYYSWHQVANILFLESPAGVGFSYEEANDTTQGERFETGDKQTTDDSYTFLINWLQRFPEYLNRDFYISGDDYGGHYVTQLAYIINHRNEKAAKILINLKGILVGNGRFDAALEKKTSYEFRWRHGIITDDIWLTIDRDCDFENDDDSTPDYDDALKRADEATGSICMYNIYAPPCQPNIPCNRDHRRFVDFDPCSIEYVSSYLNLEELQKALHVPQIDWASCRSDILWKEEASKHTMQIIIKDNLNSQIRILFYGGDLNSYIPAFAVKRFIEKHFALPIKKAWRAWNSSSVLGGFVEDYERLTIATVRGAGHMVAAYQPKRALDLISKFINGESFDNS